MGIKLYLTSEQILNHIFQPVKNGYDPLQVDEFLDKVLSDYRQIESNYLISKFEKEKLESDLSLLKEKNSSLEIELGKFKAQFSNIKPSDNVNSDNINLIQRINQLESFLFKEGYDPSKIK